MKNIKIGNKTVGEDMPTYVIAEAGVNHNGSLDRAKELIIEAAKAGADAIKFQTYTAEELVCMNTPKFWNFEDDKNNDQFQAYKALGGEPREWYPELIKCCEENNIEFLTTCFSSETSDYFHSIGMNAFKVASSDMSHIPFLKHIAKFNKPILLSTGASTMDEIIESVNVIKEEGNNQIIILHCTLCYPTMYPDRDVHYEDANLSLIRTLKDQFPDLNVGISDHTQTSFSSVIACAMGACVVEKHYTIDKKLGMSADHWFSVDPKELKEIVDGCRKVEMLKGSKDKKVFDCEHETRLYDKRSVVTKIRINKGENIKLENLTCKRPGTGIFPRHMEELVGMTAVIDIPEDSVITWEMLKE